jgi:hypothetical protein
VGAVCFACFLTLAVIPASGFPDLDQAARRRFLVGPSPAGHPPFAAFFKSLQILHFTLRLPVALNGVSSLLKKGSDPLEGSENHCCHHVCLIFFSVVMTISRETIAVKHRVEGYWR